jgi:hypothetical protein
VTAAPLLRVVVEPAPIRDEQGNVIEVLGE